MNRAEWMNGICLVWSRGQLISPSLPVGGDRCLNLSLAARAVISGEIVRYDALASRLGVLLSWYLTCACAHCLEHKFSRYSKIQLVLAITREFCKGSPPCILAKIAHFEKNRFLSYYFIE